MNKHSSGQHHILDKMLVWQCMEVYIAFHLAGGYPDTSLHFSNNCKAGIGPKSRESKETNMCVCRSLIAMCIKKLPTNQTKPPAWLNTGSGKRVFCTVEKFLVKEKESESERNTQL